MRIAVIAHIRYAITERARGSVEAHCRNLCAGLRARGHSVTLFAASGSDDPNLSAICETPHEVTLPWDVWRGSVELTAFQRSAFGKAWERILAGGFDVVHNNCLFPDVVSWASRHGIACVTSHISPPLGLMRKVIEEKANIPGHVITVPSRHHFSFWSHAVRMRMAVVPNGVCPDIWQPVDEREDYFIWAGSIEPSKGTALAARAARIAGAKLKIVGPVKDATYYAVEVEPFLKDGVEYHGHRSSQELAAMMARARAAIVTPMWDEPYSLIAAEALSCGIPVVAFDRGALSDMVGECGIVVPPGDVTMLALAMAASERLDRFACHERAQKTFGLPKMIDGYEACYDAAIASAQ